MLLKNRHLKTLFSLNIFFVFGINLLGPLYAVFVKNIGGNILTIGWSFAVYMLVLGIVAYGTGKLGDRVKEKEYLLAVGYLFRSVAFFGYIFIQTPFHLLFAQIILGLGEAFGNPSFKAIFSEHLDEGKYCSEWGTWDAFRSIAIGVSAIIGAFIVNLFGFTPLFLIIGTVALICFIITLLLPRKIL